MVPQVGGGVYPGCMPSGGSRRVDIRVHEQIDQLSRRSWSKKLVQEVGPRSRRRLGTGSAALLKNEEALHRLQTAQRGGLSEAARTQSIDPKSVESKTRESKESGLIIENKLLTADGDARNTHAQLLRKVRANGARKARGEATAGAAKAPSTAEGKENRTCAHVEHGFYCLRLLHSSAVALIGGCTVGACTVGGWTVGGWTVGGKALWCLWGSARARGAVHDDDDACVARVHRGELRRREQQRHQERQGGQEN